jgi:hypothetical protein
MTILNTAARPVKGRAVAAEAAPRAKPGALTRDVNTRLRAAEMDPQTKPGAPAGAGVRADTPAPAAASAAVACRGLAFREAAR